MLDSLLTLTKAGALWLTAAFLVSLAADRGLSALFGRQEGVFLLLALVSLAALLVTGTYTLIKLLIHAVRRDDGAAPPTD